MEAVLWGQNKARFVVGRELDGTNRKLRCYPRPLYAGARIWEYPAETEWLVGCKRASDGAMEVTAAFPFPPRLEMPEETAYNPIQEQKLSLDGQILLAQRK